MIRKKRPARPSKYGARSASSRRPRAKTIKVRVASFAFADTLNAMRKWLDHRGCAPSRFNCNREGRATVTVQIEFSEKFKAIAREFEEQFAGPATAAATS